MLAVYCGLVYTAGIPYTYQKGRNSIRDIIGTHLPSIESVLHNNKLVKTLQHPFSYNKKSKNRSFSQMFELFDRFLLLCRGEVVFHGTADGALPYFSCLGFDVKKDWNPSDFLLDLVSYHGTQSGGDATPSTGEGEKTTQMEQECHSTLVDLWRASEGCLMLASEIDEVDATAYDVLGSKFITEKKEPSACCCGYQWFFEVLTLWKRQTINTLRNPITIIVTLLILVMQILIVG